MGAERVAEHQDRAPDESQKPSITWISVGSEKFLVLQYQSEGWKTLVLEKFLNPHCFVQRAEIPHLLDPNHAVLGYLLRKQHDLDPLSDLKRRLASMEKAYWRIFNENMALKSKTLARKKKRG